MVATAFGNVTPELAASLRAAWDAVNNGWNQWVLNYTQSKQLDLLKDLGFQSPSWEDLSYRAAGPDRHGGTGRRRLDAVGPPPARPLAAAAGAHAPSGCGRAGLELPAAAPPREIATLVTARFGERGHALADWLLKLEAQRYARTPATTLPALRREFKQLAWPA